MFPYDILKIIIGYTPPLSLHPLFDMYNITLTTKFKYDASYFCSSIAFFNYIFDRFTNIIITGIRADLLSHLIYIKHDPRTIKRLILEWFDDHPFIHPQLNYTLENYKNVRYFEIKRVYRPLSLLLTTLICFETLKTITLRCESFDINHFNWLKKYVNLHHITLEIVKMDYEININVLEQMSKLRTICIQKCSDFYEVQNKFKKLKKLVIKKCSRVSMSQFKECNKLKYVEIEGNELGTDIMDVTECKQVSHWTFENVHGTWNFGIGTKTIEMFGSNLGHMLNFKWDLTRVLIAFSETLEVLELTTVNNIEIIGCPRLQKISVQKAESIKIRECDGLNNLCGKIKTLKLSNTNLLNLEHVQNLTNLCFNKCNNLMCAKAISECQDLETLEFSFCTKLRNLIGLEKCTKLKDIRLEGCTSVTKADPLIDHNSLERIGLCQHHRLKTYYVEMLKDKIYDIYYGPNHSYNC